MISRSSTIQSRSCRTQCHGSFQSSRITRRVSGIDCRVNTGFSKGANDGEGSERRYIDNRARISRSSQLYASSSNIGSHLHDPHLARLGTYSLEQNRSRLQASSYIDPEIFLEHPKQASRETLSGCLESLLSCLSVGTPRNHCVTNPERLCSSLGVSSHWPHCQAWMTTFLCRIRHCFGICRVCQCWLILGL